MEGFGIKIFLDDIRAVDFKTLQYNLIRNYEYCIALIDAFGDELDFISLDYHLGNASEHTGYDVLVYMHEHGISPDHINIHSDHYTGVIQMEKYARENFQSSTLTKNPV